MLFETVVFTQHSIMSFTFEECRFNVDNVRLCDSYQVITPIWKGFIVYISLSYPESLSKCGLDHFVSPS